MKIVCYRRIRPGRLSSADLSETAEAILRERARAEAYRVTVFELDADEPPGHAEAVYIPMTHRLGVASAGPVTWARVPDLHSGLQVWADDPEGWDALTGPD